MACMHDTHMTHTRTTTASVVKAKIGSRLVGIGMHLYADNGICGRPWEIRGGAHVDSRKIRLQAKA